MTPSSPTRSIHDAPSIFYEWSKRIAHCTRSAMVDKHENTSSCMKRDVEIVTVRKTGVVRKGNNPSRAFLRDSQNCRAKT